MKYLIKKIATLIITLFIVSIITFLAFQIIPGDSASVSMGLEGNEENLNAIREEMGLNDSIAVRYMRWIKDILRGDFGMSSQYKLPVKDLLLERSQVTVGLAVISIIFIVVFSIPLGIWCGKNKGKFIDKLITIISQINMAVPPFFLGIIITLIFGIVFKCFTPGKYISMKESFIGYLKYMIFPAIAISLPKIAMVIKFLRSSILRQLKADYVRTAKSKGNTANKVLYGHVLKNAFIPVITFLAMILADVLAGSIVVEQVFSLPGLGRLLITAIGNRDLFIVQAVVLYIASIVIVINCIVDILYRVIDPRVRV